MTIGVVALAQVPAAAAPRGALRPLAKGACIAVHAPRSCAHGRALGGVSDLVVTPDGRNVYAATDAGLAAFARNARTGALEQLAGSAGCASQSGKAGCAKARGVDSAIAIAASPDGNNVYLAGSALAIFSRDPSTGALTQLPGSGGCVNGKGTGGCAASAALGEDGPSAVAVSHDGSTVYTAGGAVITFTRDHATGALSQLSGPSGCITPADSSGAGCTRGHGLGTGGLEESGIVVTPDDRNVYVSVLGVEVPEKTALAIFSRDTGTGALTQPAGAAACVRPNSDGEAGCAKVGKALPFSAGALAVSSDGRSIYVPDAGDVSGLGADIGGGLDVLSRDGVSGALAQLQTRFGCFQFHFASGFPAFCGRIGTLFRSNAAEVSADGRSVYVADQLANSWHTGAIGIFARDRRTGALTQLPRTHGCVGAFGRCTRVPALATASAVRASPDGRNVYATGTVGRSGSSILAFRRQR